MRFRSLTPKLAVLLAVQLYPATALDLKHARVFSSGETAAAVNTLIEEVARRTQIRMSVTTSWLSQDTPAIAVVVGSPSGLPPAVISGMPAAPAGDEGFRIHQRGNIVVVSGNSPRGALFGVGYLLRQLYMDLGLLELRRELHIATSPAKALRGHQIGYRPKVNTYDAWTPAMFEQYVRDLAVFGANAIELIPPRSDDDDLSPHFRLPKLEMMIEMSRIIAKYGLEVWVWYPAMDEDYSKPDTVEFALQEWESVFKRLPRMDAVLVPGGDPGHTQPKYLFPMLEKQTARLRRYHPQASIWVSPQGFTDSWMQEFLGLVRTEPEWLGGVVFGPQVRMPLAELRKQVPARYPIRLYPDITHTVHGEYTVPDWDMAFAITQGREIYSPRPVDEAIIFRQTAPFAIGAISYSEGVNDDVNKMLWSVLGWDPKADVKQFLREFARYFIGSRMEEQVAEGLLSLEKNWRGPLISNTSVDTTLAQFRQMEKEASPRDLLNWRFQQMLFRGYFDSYVRKRLIYETDLENQALERLRAAGAMGSMVAMREAERTLDCAVTAPVASDLHGRMNELAEALYQSIGAQLSVDKYKALAVSRGASLDTADVPLNSRHWLESQFAALRKLSSEADRLAGIEAILNRANPGPGGFYDDLGNPAAQPHLELGPSYAEDPDYFVAPKSNYLVFGGGVNGRRSVEALLPEGAAAFLRYPTAWWSFAEARWNGAISMRYRDLDPNCAYRLKVVYVSRSSREARIKLVANDAMEIHPYLKKPPQFSVMEFDIPREATASGELRLRWTGDPEVGGPGNGPMIAEVFLMRK
jgi:hypothetical protein